MMRRWFGVFALALLAVTVPCGANTLDNRSADTRGARASQLSGDSATAVAAADAHRASSTSAVADDSATAPAGLVESLGMLVPFLFFTVWYVIAGRRSHRRT